MTVTHLVIFTVLFAGALAEFTKASFHPCPYVLPEHCTVTEVRIDPCRVNKPCVFKRGYNASLAFDFTPNFVASKLKTGVFWAASSGEIPFLGMSTDNGCDLTTCPTAVSTSQTLSYNLYIGKKLPPGSYPIKWKVWNEDVNTEVCCFQTTIEIKRK